MKGVAEMGAGLLLAVLVPVLMLLAGCSEPEAVGGGESFPEVRLQTDWFAQPEHGGFYYAQAAGYYEDAGLDVEILEGGPNSQSVQKVLQGRVQFAMNRADTIISYVDQGLPLVIVAATLQHDPQALLLHEDNPIDSFEELDGQRIMAVPGFAWIDYLKARYEIDFEILPHDYGMERFLSDKSFIQQCMLTNEPFYVRQQGANPKVLPLRESGFDPYHVIYTSREFAQEHPEVVRKFVEASIEGWKDYVRKDPAPAHRLIAERNPKMSWDFMSYGRGILMQRQLVSGNESEGEAVGLLKPERLREVRDILYELGLIEERLPLERFMTTGFLPNDIQALTGESVPLLRDEAVKE